MSARLLRLEGVAMQYGKGEASVTALSGIDLEVQAGLAQLCRHSLG